MLSRKSEGPGAMKSPNPLLALDSNVLIAAIRTLEPDSEKCDKILAKASDQFILTEPSIIYQEVCGTIARKMNVRFANNAKEQLDLFIPPKRLVNCDRKTCVAAFKLCAEHKIYAVDALYLHVALLNHAILVSLDQEFIKGLNSDKLPIEAYTVDFLLASFNVCRCFFFATTLNIIIDIALM